MDFFVAKANHAVIVSFDPGRSQGIVFGNARIVMNTTVKFNDEFTGRAVKVENEGFYRVLKAKLQPVQPPCAERLPENLFCKRCFAP